MPLTIHKKHTQQSLLQMIDSQLTLELNEKEKDDNVFNINSTQSKTNVDAQSQTGHHIDKALFVSSLNIIK